jgi:hypothetical protein
MTYIPGTDFTTELIGRRITEILRVGFWPSGIFVVLVKEVEFFCWWQIEVRVLFEDIPQR